jgi:hypothetical protein
VRRLKIWPRLGCQDILKVGSEIAPRVALKIVVELYCVFGFWVSLSVFRTRARRDSHIPGAMRVLTIK